MKKKYLVFIEGLAVEFVYWQFESAHDLGLNTEITLPDLYLRDMNLRVSQQGTTKPIRVWYEIDQKMYDDNDQLVLFMPIHHFRFYNSQTAKGLSVGELEPYGILEI